MVVVVSLELGLDGDGSADVVFERVRRRVGGAGDCFLVEADMMGVWVGVEAF